MCKSFCDVVVAIEMRHSTTFNVQGHRHESWVLHRLAVARTQREFSFIESLWEHLRWDVLATFLSMFRSLGSLYILVGHSIGDKDPELEEILKAVNYHPAVTLQYDGAAPSGTYLAPEMFYFDVEERKKVRRWRGEHGTFSNNIYCLL